jgi:hypothetical protein
MKRLMQKAVGLEPQGVAQVQAVGVAVALGAAGVQGAAGVPYFQVVERVLS